tara:strand:- start:3043 stop:3348 length:306 start_codon:yes stop_codon:yes gene_type:complete
MSHEYQTKPITYIETDYEYDNDFGVVYDYDTIEGFLYVPNIPDFFTQQFEGLYYDGISYSWDEIDYRMGVEYIPSVPEPSSVGLVMGTIFTAFVLIKKITK